MMKRFLSKIYKKKLWSFFNKNLCSILSPASSNFQYNLHIKKLFSFQKDKENLPWFIWHFRRKLGITILMQNFHFWIKQFENSKTTVVQNCWKSCLSIIEEESFIPKKLYLFGRAVHGSYHTYMFRYPYSI